MALELDSPVQGHGGVTTSSPSLAAVQVNSTSVFVYVKVDNIGTVDLGACTCTSVGAWAGVTFFAGFFASPNGNTTQTQFGTTVTISSTGDSLTGSGINRSFGFPGSGRRAWAWSPDGRFFAYASSANGPDYSLTIVALQNVTRSDGTIVMKGQIAVNSSGLFAGPWTNATFGWAGSKAVAASGAYAGGSGIVRSLSCPEAPNPNTWGELVPDFPGQIGWVVLVSPCGSVVAFVPKILNASAGPRDLFWVATSNAKVIQIRKNNVPTTVSITGANPSITTNQHAANGVRINTGSATVDVDDPDCTFVGGGIVVRVDRVKASTLPSANLGVASIGSAVLGQLLVNKSGWVQVPNQTGWANQSEKHWCLLA